MPLVEAMASHTPVVATRGGAFREIAEDAGAACLWSAETRKLRPARSCNSCQPETAYRAGPGGSERASLRCSSGTVLQRIFSRSMNAFSHPAICGKFFVQKTFAGP